MNQKELLESQKECASMLGISLKDYLNLCKNTKIKKIKEKRRKYDNSILYELGLTEKDLLKRTRII